MSLNPNGYTEYDCTWEERVAWHLRFEHWPELTRLLARITLPREGWSLIAEPSRNYVLFTGPVIDTMTGEPQVISHRFQPPSYPAWEPAFWVRWVVDRLEDIERHELCEAFMVDGIRVYQPHGENGAGHYGIREAPNVDLRHLLDHGV